MSCISHTDRFNPQLCKDGRARYRDAMNITLSILMLAGFALSIGAIYRFRRGERRGALLMLVAALVAFANVAVWLMPVG